jgi:HD-like signal output (HDOD) protein
MNDILIHQIKQCPTLPSLPKVAIEVLGLAEEPDVALPALAKLISQDAALVARTLKTVNSPFYGLSHTVSTIDHALVVLGLEGVKTIVLGLSLVQNLKKHRARGEFDHVAYWRRSLYAATAARVLAERFGAPPEEAFLSALLMDVGMLALDQVLGKDYAELSERAAGHAGLPALETARLGMTHADVAGVLAEQWKLPELLAQPMRYHHRPQAIEPSVARDVAEVVWLAGRCAAVFVDRQPEWSLCDVRRACIERYKVNEIECDSILCEIGMKTHQLAPMFDVAMDASAGGYEGVLRRASDALLNMTKVLSVEDGGAGGKATDKRRAPRFARGGSLPIFPYSSGRVGDPVRAEFRDASAQGIGLSVRLPLQLGSQFVIRVPRKNGEPLPILYTVVRSGRADGPGEFGIGAELASVLRAEDFGELEGAATAIAASTSRKDASGVDRIRRAILESA